MANGVLVSSASLGRDDDLAAGVRAIRWRPTSRPRRSGASTCSISNVDGIPSYVAVDPQLAKGQVLSKLPEVVRFYASIYGEYPFNAVGAIVHKRQERRLLVGDTDEAELPPYVPDEATLVHELAHMWYGDSVTLTQWPDIWLHEGFATWSEWIWSEHQGNKTAAQWFKQLHNTPAQNDAFWNPPPGDPGSPVYLFNGTIYYRGAMTLQALRERVGDPTFFRIMRDWAQQNRFGNVTTPEFIALAERDSGLNLEHFFDVWLYQPGKPTNW